MKILTVVYNLEKGGTQRAAQVFAKAYGALGHDSRVLSLYGLGYRHSEMKNYIDIWDGLTGNNKDYIKKWNPDIIHIHSHGPKKKDIEMLINQIPKANIIETNVFSTPSPWADRVDISFQLSNWAQWIFNLRDGSKYRSEIVPYPVECSSFKKAKKEDIDRFKSKYNIPGGSFIMGRIGQAFPGKWSPMLIECFNSLAKYDDNVYLIIVNAPENILNLVKKSAHRSRIVIIQSIMGDKNLSIAYSAMDVMVLIAEQGESFGMVSAEAILCETPVVALSTPWADNSQCEVVGNLIGGYIVNGKKGVIKAVSLIIEGKQRFNLKSDGIKHIYKNYSHTVVAQKALDCLSVTGKCGHVDQEILSIAKNTLDNISIFTRIILALNKNKLRYLTIYTSGYKKWRELYLIVIKKLVK